MDKSKQVIWQVLDSRNMGGIESHVLELSTGLMNAGWPVEVIFLQDYGTHPLKEKLIKSAIPFKCLDGKTTSLWRALQKQKPMVIHTHGYKAGFLGRFLGKVAKVRVVSTYHAGEATSGKLALYTFLDRISARLSSPIAVSEKIARQLPKKTKCINNFVALPELKQKAQGKCIAFVGRLSSEKGPDLFCKMAKDHPALTFKIFGDGPLRSCLEKRYGEHVEFHGQVDMNNHWHEIDLLCMPSRFEGLPMAALEAMARAIPVLASDAGSLPRLIDHHQTGWVIPLNQLSKYNDTIRTWHELEPKIRKVIGEKARRKISALYSPEAIIPQIEDIYLDAVGAVR